MDPSTLERCASSMHRYESSTSKQPLSATSSRLLLLTLPSPPTPACAPVASTQQMFMSTAKQLDSYTDEECFMSSKTEPPTAPAGAAVALVRAAAAAAVANTFVGTAPGDVIADKDATAPLLIAIFPRSVSICFSCKASAIMMRISFCSASSSSALVGSMARARLIDSSASTCKPNSLSRYYALRDSA